MGMNNIELYNLAKKYLGTRGADARSYCGLPNGAAWCCAFVTWIFYKGGDRNLFYGGSKVVYCPTAISWCRANLAQIPIYLSLPMDIIFFDWQPNGTPDHIGFVKERKSDQDVYTIEGNTSGGIVAEKVRPDKYVCGCFRPAFPATWKDGALTVDGYFGYSSVAMLQKALKSKGLYSDSVDGILGKNTVKAVQKLCGVAQDGSWGVKTSKAMQRFLGVTVDGAWGMASTKALQTWINKTNGSQPAPQPTPKPTPTPSGKLVVDGKGGVATVKAMQRFFGTTQDGVISGQNKDLKKYYSTLESVSFGKGGSLCIQRLQKWVGANQDGVLGQITVKLWQKKIGVQQSGYFGAESMKKWQTYLNEHDKAVYPVAPAKTIVDKELDACKVQADWMKNSKYEYESHPTIEKSKKKGTCVTYVACVLQRIGVLKSGQNLWHSESGKVYGNNDKMTVTYPKGKTLHQIKSQLKAGDIVMDGSGVGSNSHIFILTGKWSGDNPIIWDNHSGQQSKGAYTYTRNRKVIAYVRLK